MALSNAEYNAYYKRAEAQTRGVVVISTVCPHCWGAIPPYPNASPIILTELGVARDCECESPAGWTRDEPYVAHGLLGSTFPSEKTEMRASP